MDTQLFKRAAKGVTLLYVEDEDDLRSSVGRYLKKIFDHVTIAIDGQEGLRLYQKQQYDIVITDIQMPVMNGLEMAKEIKMINPTQEIIIISAYSDTVYFLDAIRLGINGYILKPIDYLQMNQVILIILKKILSTRCILKRWSKSVLLRPLPFKRRRSRTLKGHLHLLSQ